LEKILFCLPPLPHGGGERHGKSQPPPFRGDPVPVTTVQLGASLAGNDSSLVSSTTSHAIGDGTGTPPGSAAGDVFSSRWDASFAPEQLAERTISIIILPVKRARAG
jgi:hypothetical protein